MEKEEWNIEPQQLKSDLSSYILIDVRTAEEFFGSEGHIEKSQLFTIGEDFQSFLKKADSQFTYVMICRSGVRSWFATEQARAIGLEAYNLKGGMLAWNGSL